MEIISDYLRCRSINTGFEKKTGIVWLAHTKELCQQSSESFRLTWDLRGDTAIDVYDLYGDNEYPEKLLDSEKFIVFAGFQKMHALRNSNKDLQKKIKRKLRNDTNLVIVDEST
ncbi:MAG: hypothetical protein U5K72_17690 [Balneolaceae bacterium]|nr:hypothetical protein [Balneolaceae bacterium]